MESIDMSIAKISGAWWMVLALAAMTSATGCDREDPIVANGANTPPAPAAPAPQTPTTRPASKTDEPVDFSNGFKDVTGPVKPDKVTAKVIQTLPVFNHPVSCAVGRGGKFLFVTNSAATSNGFLYNKGAISKLSIAADGRLTMIKADFVPDLHAPQGIAVLTKATAKFPAGSLFVSTGAASGCDEKDLRITDISKFSPGVAIYHPDTGQKLGFIPMGDKHAVAEAIYHQVLVPAGLCFDPDGNLYVADSGNTGKYLDPEAIGRPGLLRILNGEIDSYANDKAPGRIAYLPVLHIPSAVTYSPLDDALYWTTCDGQTGAGGAVFRSPRANFPEQTMVGSVVGDLGALQGVCITPNGSLIASRVDGDLALVTKKMLGQVGFYDSGSFSSPGDIKLLSLPNGYNVLYVPEQETFSTTPWRQRLRVILLPSAI